MKPRTIRYVLGRHDTFKVHNNCDPIQYITSQGLRAEPSSRARLIEAACEKSFVSFESNGIPIPIVLAPSKYYHVSGVIQELTPELTPVSLTPSEEDQSTSTNLIDMSESTDTDDKGTPPLNHNSSLSQTKQDLNDNLDLIESNADAASVDTLKESQTSRDDIAVNHNTTGLQVQSLSNNVTSTGPTFSYTGVAFDIDYEESNELALIGRLMTPSTFRKALYLGKTYSKSALQSAGIQKPQDIPFRITLELLPIIIRLLLLDSRYLLDLLRDSNHNLNCQSQLSTLLINNIINIKNNGGTKFNHTLLTPPLSKELVTRTVTVLSALIYESIESDRHLTIYSIFKKVYSQSKNLTGTRSYTFIDIPSEICFKIIEQKDLYASYIQNIPWIVHSIIEVIFLQFYSIHKIKLINSEGSDHLSSLKRLYNICIFILACLLLHQCSEEQDFSATASQHTSPLTTAPHQSVFLSLGISLLKYTQSWLKESPEGYYSLTQQTSVLIKLDKYLGDWGIVNIFLRNSLLRIAIAGLTPGAELPFFIQQSVTLTKADEHLGNYYSGEYLELENLIGCLFGLPQKPLMIESQRIISIYFSLMTYIGTNSKCIGALTSILTIFLKFRWQQDNTDVKKVGEKLGKELADIYERIRKPLIDSRAIIDVKSRKKMSSPVPCMFICFLLIFISHIMLRVNSVVNNSIHVFLYSWNDASLLLYPLIIYTFASGYYQNRIVKLKTSQSSNLSYLMTLYNDISIHLEGSIETEPGVKRTTDTSSKLLTISIEEARETSTLANIVDESSSQDEIKIYVHTSLFNQYELQCASLITSVPCQFAISEQLITHCDILSTLRF